MAWPLGFHDDCASAVEADRNRGSTVGFNQAEILGRDRTGA
jgi:hypothetical protein